MVGRAGDRVASFVVAECVFCEIVDGSRPAHIVLDDDTCLAFLDRRPLFLGHTLLIPKPHHETLVDLPTDLIGPLFGRAQQTAPAMERVLGAGGSFVALNNRVSQSVAHLHIHVVPRNPKDGLRGFFWPRTSYADEADMAAMAERLRRGIDLAG